MSKLLVVVDMQNDFIDGVLGNAECKATVPEVVKLIESGEYDKLVYTQDTHYANYLETQEGRNLPVVHCIDGTTGWDLNESVAFAIDSTQFETVLALRKNTFGCQELLYKNIYDDVTEVHLCGVCTGICVISNAMFLKTILPEVKICVVEKACACVTPETHKTALEAMKLCQIEII